MDASGGDGRCTGHLPMTLHGDPRDYHTTTKRQSTWSPSQGSVRPLCSCVGLAWSDCNNTGHYKRTLSKDRLNVGKVQARRKGKNR